MEAARRRRGQRVGAAAGAALVAMGAGTASAAIPFYSGPVTAPTASAPAALAVADLTRDGRPDVVVAGFDGQVVVLPGAGDGSFAPGTPVQSATSASAVAVGDLDGDGLADVAVANPVTATVSVLVGDGKGGLVQASTQAVGSTPLALQAGDLNGDGRLDLAVANAGDGSIGVLLGSGDGTFPAQVSVPVPAPVGLARADLNGDGRQDLVAISAGSANVSVLLGKADGGFDTPVTVSTGSALPFGSAPATIALGDLSGDGKLDLAVNRGDGLVVLNGDGAGGFGTPVSAPAGSAGLTGIILSDLNGDGHGDALLADAARRRLVVLLGDATGALVTAVSYPTGFAPTFPTPADLNGDGTLDLVAGSGQPGVLAMLQSPARPVLFGLQATPVRFRVAPCARRPAQPGRCKERSTRNGTRLTFSLSAPATVRFVVRRVGGRAMGSFSARAALGANTVRFTGALGLTALAPGKYTIVAQATNPVGPSRPVSIQVTVRV